ncbi:YbaK/EbsC family protein [Candidatus Reidiella endopervernicosa]|uniref:YbaK/EbsC family protein n=1 Tax=Candidatus Reidiella endopervernicosa TaxID=2738883 RepID=A0A6N0HUC2_9GAMM|nr:YbaK/EbsC family protein [Candidatus Reidiella endopervernicosa]QKQ25959.1 YbaK/EbsC family protein [Candidatus Reidiella endopervernicosa]
MKLPEKIANYLQLLNIGYAAIVHPRTGSLEQIASHTGIGLERLARAAIFEDSHGLLMAVLPASRQVDINALRSEMGRPELEPAKRETIMALLSDCAEGAIPPIAAAYAIDAIVDNRFESCDEIYVISGNNESLLRLSNSDVYLLHTGSWHGDISMLGKPISRGVTRELVIPEKIAGTLTDADRHG